MRTTPTPPRTQPAEPRRSIAPPVGLLLGIGTGCVILGGLVAAVTGPLQLADGSWVAAYLVLVGGVAQCALGLAPSWLAARPLPQRLYWTQLACWNVGNALVIAGALITLPALVDAGAAFLLFGLAIAWRAIHSTQPGRATRLAGWAYRVVLILLALSIPVGVVLAHLPTPA